MISFRYHVVTVVAVFLAIGVGVLVGTTVLDQGLVSNLKDQTQELEHRVAAAEKHAAQTDDAVKDLEGFVRDATPYLITDRLVGQDVVVVTYDGIDRGPRDEAVDALNESGARVVAVLSVTAKMASDDQDTRTQLAKLLGQSVSAPASPGPTATPVDPLAVEAAAALGDRLAAGRRQGDLPPKPGHPDILAGLLDDGFVKSSVAPGDLPAVGGPGQVVLVVAGGDQPPPIPVAGFMLPLAEQVGQHTSTWLAVGEDSEAAADPLVPAVRLDPLLSSSDMVTVDDLGADFGGVSLVLGLQALIDDGLSGDYGVLDGTDGLIPQAP